MLLENNKWYQQILNWLFPARCPACDEILPMGEGRICNRCKGKFRLVREPHCLKCGKPIADVNEEYCYDCKSRKHKFIKGRALFSYESVAESVYRFKYAKRAEYAEFYAEEIVKNLGVEIKSWNADALIPVPLYSTKYYQRGYNQAELLAKQIGKRLNIPVEVNVIKRIRKTLPQKQLNVLQRQNNLKKAFKIVQNDVKLKTIIIIDDIFTTGSTIDAMAEEILKTSVQNIYFVALAIGNEQK